MLDRVPAPPWDDVSQGKGSDEGFRRWLAPAVWADLGMNQDAGEAGTAYRIRTGDLRLERAVSWASRRMRRRVRGLAATGRDDTNRALRAPSPAPRQASVQSVRLEEPADRLGDLLVALLADHQAVVRVRPERLERRRPATPPAAPTSTPGTWRSSAAPIDELAGSSTTGRGIDRHALSIWRRARPLSCGFWPSMCWMRSDVLERQVALVALSSFSGSVAQPMTELP